MAEQPDKRAWDHRTVHVALAAEGVATSPENVARTPARMAADGELVRAGHGRYALPVVVPR